MIPLVLALMLAAPAPVAVPGAPPDKPRLVCRESEQETGSHIHTSRRCKTAEEWLVEDKKRAAVPPNIRENRGRFDGLTKDLPAH